MNFSEGMWRERKDNRLRCERWRNSASSGLEERSVIKRDEKE
jgi:hypothetical protein